MITAKKKQDWLYTSISLRLQQQISDNVLKLGDKLPSIRTICQENGVSMSTVLQAYYDLESKGLIESKPKSGYFVSFSKDHFPSIPETSQPLNKELAEDTADFVVKTFNELGTNKTLSFSLGVPAKELLPLAKLNKVLVQAMRDLKGGGTSYEEIQGNPKLRLQIAKWSYTWGGRLKDSDIITTAGCMNSISYCMLALTKRGDTIVVESPVYFGILQLAQSLGLKVIELPTNAITGIEIDTLKKTILKRKVNLCILVSNFSNPMGSCMPDENKKEVVRLLEKHNIPLIEDDLYGDIYFGNSRQKSCKSFDESGNVLWCGSVSKTLAPGYRVGWVAPGKYKDKVLKTKLFHSISSTSVTQEAIANFLENGRYENHLKKFRQTLYGNQVQYLKTFGEYFPEDTKVSHPKGGFVLWLELNKKVDTMKIYRAASKHNITIAPGRMFTLQKQYDNCMRLSYGLLWNEKINSALKTLGKIIQGEK